MESKVEPQGGTAYFAFNFLYWLSYIQSCNVNSERIYMVLVCQDYVVYLTAYPYRCPLVFKKENHHSMHYFFCYEKTLLISASLHRYSTCSSLAVTISSWSLEHWVNPGFIYRAEIESVLFCLEFIICLCLSRLIRESIHWICTCNIAPYLDKRVKQVLATNDRILRRNSGQENSTNVEKKFFFRPNE